MASLLARPHAQRALLRSFLNLESQTSPTILLRNSSRYATQKTFISTNTQLSSLRAQLRISWRNRTTQMTRQVRHNTNKTNPQRPATQAAPSTTTPTTPAKPLSLSGRMKEMSKKYGWSVVGIYLALSALDFPFCFLAVKLFGVDRIGEAEHYVVETFWSVVARVAPSAAERWHGATEEIDEEEMTAAAKEERDEAAAAAATKRAHAHAEASIWTQLILAYGVHKSLIFFRIPLTLAVTPRVVRTLRGWGWKIGPKAA